MPWPTSERPKSDGRISLSQFTTLSASLCMALNLERGDFGGVLIQAVLGGERSMTVSMNERPE